MKIHCSILAEDAIKAAVADCKKAQHPGQRGRLMAVTLTSTAAGHVQRSPKRGKGLGLRVGVRTSGFSGLAYKLEFAGQVGRRLSSSRATV